MEDEGIATFGRGEDADYENWVSRNVGYVLVEGNSGLMLHNSRCTHLDLTPGQFTLTERPRRCSRTRKTLIDFAVQTTGEEPARCQSCQ